MKDIKEEFTKKYSKYGSIDSWVKDELMMNKAFAYHSALEFKYRKKIQ